MALAPASRHHPQKAPCRSGSAALQPPPRAAQTHGNATTPHAASGDVAAGGPGPPPPPVAKKPLPACTNGSLRVVSLGGAMVATVPFRTAETVFEFKVRIQGITTIHPHQQQLVHSSLMLRNSDRFEDRAVVDGDTVQLIVSRRLMALTGGFDRTLRLWDAACGECLEVLVDPEYAPIAATVNFNEMRALVGYNGGSLRILCLTTGGCINEFGPHGSAIMSLAAGWELSMALTGSSDGSLALWNLHDGSIEKRLEGHRNEVMALSVNWRAMFAVSASADASIRVWDLRSGTCIGTLLEAHFGPVLTVDVDWADAVSPGRSPSVTKLGRAISGGANDHVLKVWNLEGDLSQCKAAQILEGHHGGVWSVVCDWASERAISASGDHDLRLWDIKGDGATLAVFEGHTGVVWSVAVSWDDGLAFSISHDQTMRVWSIDEGECRWTLDVEASGRFVALK
mmetsp:Transcript_117622/g.332749  ORF Transcript_117622/g.332749 Transcript_117622/m.332749 type:complete len:454 (-) Transcript_117622:1-1362(-)